MVVNAAVLIAGSLGIATLISLDDHVGGLGRIGKTAVMFVGIGVAISGHRRRNPHGDRTHRMGTMAPPTGPPDNQNPAHRRPLMEAYMVDGGDSVEPTSEGATMAAEKYWPMVVVLMMFAFWARATYGVGLTAIIMGVWLLMAPVAGATWIVARWNRWWVWGAVSMAFPILAAAAPEFITIVEEF